MYMCACKRKKKEEQQTLIAHSIARGRALIGIYSSTTNSNSNLSNPA